MPLPFPLSSSEPKELEIWRHYKGGDYLILCIARLEATGVDQVVYFGLPGSKGQGEKWIRPVAEFLDDMGEGKARFTKV